MAALFFALIAPAPAFADVVCNPRSAFVKHLEEEYDEQPLAFGLTNDGRVIEVFTTTDGKTWTMLITNTSGISCVVVSGENWRTTLPSLLKPTGQPV